jgi:hypothetical protein
LIESIGTLIRMKEWTERIRKERDRDEYYSRPENKLSLLEHFHGKDFLASWPCATDAVQ